MPLQVNEKMRTIVEWAQVFETNRMPRVCNRSIKMPHSVSKMWLREGRKISISIYSKRFSQEGNGSSAHAPGKSWVDLNEKQNIGSDNVVTSNDELLFF